MIKFKYINGRLHVYKADFLGIPVYAPVCEVDIVESTNPDSTIRAKLKKDKTYSSIPPPDNNTKNYLQKTIEWSNNK